MIARGLGKRASSWAPRFWTAALRSLPGVQMSTLRCPHWGADLCWIDLEVSPENLRPKNTLYMGQCFNWRSLPGHNDEMWVGVVFRRPFVVKQVAHTTLVAELSEPSQREAPDRVRELFLDYFQASAPLGPLYQSWSASCPRMKMITESLAGVRVVRQEPWECVVSFICSSNNNISRITRMLAQLRERYGTYLCSVHKPHGSTVWEMSYADLSSSSQRKRKVQPAEVTEQGESLRLFAFPSAEQLAAASEEDLRGLGMGYRAKYILGTAQFVVAENARLGKDWILSLRRLGEIPAPAPSTRASSPSILRVAAAEKSVENLRNYRLEVRNELMKLPGVGPKVADCVALFSLDQPEIVPVDTHVWSIATRDYAPELKTAKSLTPSVYEQVGDVFRARFQKAGWAHSVLFAAELSLFESALPPQVVSERKQLEAMQRKQKADNSKRRKKKDD